MDSRTINDALPKQFDFYHLGRVELQSESLTSESLPENLQENLPSTLEDTTAVAFQVFGMAFDLPYWVILLFDSHLDISTYSELGNVILSKTVTQIQSTTGGDAMISPPQQMKPQQFKLVIHNTSQIPNRARRTYAHFINNSVILIEAWILPSSHSSFLGGSQKEVGYV